MTELIQSKFISIIKLSADIAKDQEAIRSQADGRKMGSMVFRDVELSYS